MSVAALPRTDPYYENTQNMAHIDILWITNLVDIFNSAMQLIEDDLASLDARLIAGGL